jgi:hypothetical protein
MQQTMPPPQWNDPKLKAGTMIRTALWLVSEVGVGNSFTKEKHRAAFSGVAQADRRLRDLRDYGWVIHTSAEDVSLNPEEQRFVSAGALVWERGARKTKATNSLTAKMRRATFAANDYQCAICGIAGGENYPDALHVTAVLVVSRRAVTASDGRVQTMFVSECKRCRSGEAAGSVDLPQLLANIRNLNAADRAVFVRWAEGGRRGALDRIWGDFRRLPGAARDQLRERLKWEFSA